MSHVESLNKVKNFYTKIACYSVCDNYGVNSDEIWMNGNWFYTTALYEAFSDGQKATPKGFHQTNLHGGQLPNLKILR